METLRQPMNLQKLSYTVNYGQVLPDALELRRKIFLEEKGYLSEDQLVTDEDRNGFNISLYYENVIIGSISGVNGEESFLSERTGLPNSAFKGSYYVSRGMLANNYRQKNLFPLLIYLICREATYNEKKTIFWYEDLNDQRSSVHHLFKPQELKNLPLLHFKGVNDYKLNLAKADVNYMRHRCWKYMPDKVKNYVRENLLVDEIKRTVLKLTDQFYQNPWFQAVFNKKLTKKQYEDVLANNYQFVQWTTRLLAKIVGITNDEELRNHYLEHLKGEINHEKILERDLKTLGADLDYIIHYMVPEVGINKFMCVQESLAAFHNDPILFLSVPIAIESLTAHLTDEFLNALGDCISRWGIAKPIDAMRYWSSHVHTDGDPDGHWDKTLESIKKFLATELDLMKFINISNMIISSVNEGFSEIMKFQDVAALSPEKEVFAKAEML